MVILSSELDVQFIVMLHNKSVQDTVLPVGTVMGNLYSTETAMAATQPKNEFDPHLINFGCAPIPEQRKTRLQQCLTNTLRPEYMIHWTAYLAVNSFHS